MYFSISLNISIFHQTFCKSSIQEKQLEYLVILQISNPAYWVTASKKTPGQRNPSFLLALQKRRNAIALSGHWQSPPAWYRTQQQKKKIYIYILGCGLYRPHHHLSVQSQCFFQRFKKTTGHVQNREQSLLKQETLRTTSRLIIPLQHDAGARECEPQFILENYNLVCKDPSSLKRELQIITISVILNLSCIRNLILT